MYLLLDGNNSQRHNETDQQYKAKNCYTEYGNFIDFCYSGKNDTPRLFVRTFYKRVVYNNAENCILYVNL